MQYMRENGEPKCISKLLKQSDWSGQVKLLKAGNV